LFEHTVISKVFLLHRANADNTAETRLGK
jgi:hypothetical protein